MAVLYIYFTDRDVWGGLWLAADCNGFKIDTQLKSFPTAKKNFPVLHLMLTFDDIFIYYLSSSQRSFRLLPKSALCSPASVSLLWSVLDIPGSETICIHVTLLYVKPVLVQSTPASTIPSAEVAWLDFNYNYYYKYF